MTCLGDGVCRDSGGDAEEAFLGRFLDRGLQGGVGRLEKLVTVNPLLLTVTVPHIHAKKKRSIPRISNKLEEKRLV